MVDEDRRLCERLEYYGWDLGPGAGSGRESGCSEKEKKKVSRLLQTRPLVTGNYVHIVNVFFEHIEIRLLISTQSKRFAGYMQKMCTTRRRWDLYMSYTHSKQHVSGVLAS